MVKPKDNEKGSGNDNVIELVLLNECLNKEY